MDVVRLAKPKEEDAVPAIVIDTREQAPYEFERSVRGTLKAGDYSLVGFETRAAIERKSLSDAFGSIGGNRDRFEREWQLLSKLDYAAVVIESSFKQFLEAPPTHSRMNPKVALLSYLAWHVKYGVPVFFAEDRRHAARLVWRLLFYWWRYHGCVGGEAVENGSCGEADRAAIGRQASRPGEMDRALPGA